MLLIALKLSFRCSFKMSPSLLVVAVQVNQLCRHLPANDGSNLTASQCRSYWEFPALYVIFSGFGLNYLISEAF
jgi:hypothetical protein